MHAIRYFLLSVPGSVEFEAHLDAESYGNAMPTTLCLEKQLHMCGSGEVLALP